MNSCKHTSHLPGSAAFSYLTTISASWTIFSQDTTSLLPCAMPVSLLTLPYELREHILTSLLCNSGSINLQHTTHCKDGLTPPISQVCRLLREEALRVFYRVNTFTLTIDPEAVSLDIVSCAPNFTCVLISTASDRTHHSCLLPSCKR